MSSAPSQKGSRRNTDLDDPTANLAKSDPGFPKRIQDHNERRAERPDHSNNDPSCKKKKKITKINLNTGQ